MSFDLYFASVGNINADNLFNELGCNRLFAWIEKSSLKRWVSISNNLESKLFIDSGAYSAHSKGLEISIDNYIEFLNNNDEAITVMAELDKIPGELNKAKTFEQRKEAPKISWENYLYMKDKVQSRDKLLPIFHQGEDFKWLKNMLYYTHPDGTHIKYIGISPQNDISATQKEPFIQKCFDIIKNSPNPDVKTHAFGMTSLELLERYPFTSADSTSWKLCAAFGSIMTDYGVILISDEQKHNPKHISNMPKIAQDTIINKIESYGLSYDLVRSLFNDRTLYNIYYLKEWADNYEYKPVKVHKKVLF